MTAFDGSDGDHNKNPYGHPPFRFDRPGWLTLFVGIAIGVMLAVATIYGLP